MGTYYFWITDRMREAGLYGPYLDMVGPFKTVEIRDRMKARAKWEAEQIFSARQGGTDSE